jgi:hypothetical protein
VIRLCDDDDGAGEMPTTTGDITQLVSTSGFKLTPADRARLKRPLGFARSVVELSCLDHPRYRGAGKPRDCAPCRRLHNAIHP